MTTRTVTIVLRPGLGLDFEAMAPALSLGAPVSIGRGGAVIAALADEDAVERLSALDEKLAGEGWQQDLTPELLGLLMAGYEKQQRTAELLVSGERLLQEYKGGTEMLEAFIESVARAIREIRQLAADGQKDQAADALRSIEALAAAWIRASEAGAARHEIAKPENVAREGKPLPPEECACGDIYPANSFGAGFMAANNGVCENCDAAEQAGATTAKNAHVAAPSAEDDQAHAEYRAAQLAGQFDIDVPTSIWKAGYAAGMVRAAPAPTGGEHLPLLQSLLDKLMSVGFEAAQQCERHAMDEGAGQQEAEQVGGWVLRGFAIAKLKLQPLLEGDLFAKLDPAGLAPLVQAFNEAPASALKPTVQDLLSQAITALGAEREQHMEVVELLTKDLDAHRAALGDDHRLKVSAPQMLATLQQVLTKVGGLFAVLDHGGKPSEQMWEEASQAIAPIWDLVAQAEGRDVSDVVEEVIHG